MILDRRWRPSPHLGLPPSLQRPRADQSRALPAGAGRSAGAGRRGGHGVPRQQRLAAGRLPRRRDVLRHLGVPDHPAADRRTRAVVPHLARTVLVPTGAASAPGGVPDDADGHAVDGDVPASGARAVARRRAGRHVLRVELVPDLGGAGLHRVGRLRTVAPPVEPRRGGAVLSDLADHHGLLLGRAGTRRVADVSRWLVRGSGGDHRARRPRVPRRPHRRAEHRHPRPTGGWATGRSRSSTPSTSARSPGPAGSCSVRPSHWCGVRTP